MNEMDYNSEIDKLQANARLVKVLSRIAISSSAISIILLLFGFDLPKPIIFLAILLVPIILVATNNYIEKFYRTKIEYIANDLLAQQIEEQVDATEDHPQKQSNYPNIEHLRTRGSDEKGPSFGINDKQFSTHNERVDAMENRDYDDIEAVNTGGEQMLRAADQRKSIQSAQHWEQSEANDADIVEAGVKNLGDLLKTGWFERNKQDDAVKRLYEDSEGNQI